MAKLPLVTGHVDRADLGELVTERLRDLIVRGELAPGTRLVETTLADACGTSRGPIRDAIGRLQVSGLVDVVPRRGAFVTSFGPDDVAELYGLRIALETTAIREVAASGTEDEWVRMEAALADLDEAIAGADPIAVGAADMRFHRELVRASGWERLRLDWEGFADQTLLLLNALSRTGSVVQSASSDHRAILDALRNHDAASSEALLREHLEAARDVLRARVVAAADDARAGSPTLDTVRL